MTTIRFDNLQRECFSRCPMEFFWAHRLHLQEVERGRPLVFGISIHAGLEHYYRAIAATGWGAHSSALIAESAEAAITCWRKESTLDGFTLGQAKEYLDESFIPTVLCDYFTTRTPIDRDRMTPLLVERYFELPLPVEAWRNIPHDPLPVIYQGNIDLVASFQGESCARTIDHKFTGQGDRAAANRLHRHPQLIGYAWAAPLAFPELGLKDVYPCANILSVSKRMTKDGSYGSTIESFTMTDHVVINPTTIYQWLEFIAYTAWQMSECDRTGFWPQSLQSCNRDWGMCPYFSLCQQCGPNTNPAAINAHGFIVRPWNPQERR